MASLLLVVLGSLVLPVVGLLWAAAWTNFWGEGREYAAMATTSYVVALLLLILGVAGLRALGLGRWAAYVIVPSVLLAVGLFLRWLSSD